MRRISLPLTLALCLPMLASACTNEAQEMTIAELADAYDEEVAVTADIVCPCPEASGFDEDSCRNIYELTRWEDSCVAELERMGDAARDALECQLEGIREINDCLSDMLVCGEAATYESCAVDEDRCPSFSVETELGSDACTVTLE